MYYLFFVLLLADMGISVLLLPLRVGPLYLLLSIGCYRAVVLRDSGRRTGKHHNCLRVGR